MDNKNDIFDDFEIIDETDFVETVNANPEPINDDWLSDFMDVEKQDNQLKSQYSEEPQTTNVTSLGNDLFEEPIENANIIEEVNVEPSMETTLTTQNVEEMLNNAELTDLNNNVNYQSNSLEQEELDSNDAIEEELNNNRSLTFIIFLFTILILFVILLPVITKMLK